MLSSVALKSRLVELSLAQTEAENAMIHVRACRKRLVEECKRLRLELGWSLNDVAEKLGCSKAWVHKLEDGTSQDVRWIFRYFNLMDFTLKSKYHESR